MCHILSLPLRRLFVCFVTVFQTLVSSHWFCWESGGVVLHVVNNNKQCVLIRRRQTVVLISESALTLTHTEENLIRSRVLRYHLVQGDD